MWGNIWRSKKGRSNSWQKKKKKKGKKSNKQKQTKKPNIDHLENWSKARIQANIYPHTQIFVILKTTSLYIYTGTQYNEWERNAFKMSRKSHPPPCIPVLELACIDSDLTIVSLLRNKATIKSVYQIPFDPVFSDSTESSLNVSPFPQRLLLCKLLEQ